MSLRVFYLTPHDQDAPSGTGVYKLTDPEMVKMALPAGAHSMTQDEIRARFDALVMACRAMDIDIVVTTPDEGYRDLLELTLTAAGVVVAYEDYFIQEDGSMCKVGYRLASCVPDEPKTPNAYAAYEQWINEVYSRLSETDIAKVVDPWKTFLQQQLRTMFQPPLH